MRVGEHCLDSEAYGLLMALLQENWSAAAGNGQDNDGVTAGALMSLAGRLVRQ